MPRGKFLSILIFASALNPFCLGSPQSHNFCLGLGSALQLQPRLSSASLFLPRPRLGLMVSVLARLSLVNNASVLGAHTRNCMFRQCDTTITEWCGTTSGFLRQVIVNVLYSPKHFSETCNRICRGVRVLTVACDLWQIQQKWNGRSHAHFAFGKEYQKSIRITACTESSQWPATVNWASRN